RLSFTGLRRSEPSEKSGASGSVADAQMNRWGSPTAADESPMSAPDAASWNPATIANRYSCSGSVIPFVPAEANPSSSAANAFSSWSLSDEPDRPICPASPLTSATSNTIAWDGRVHSRSPGSAPSASDFEANARTRPSPDPGGIVSKASPPSKGTPRREADEAAPLPRPDGPTIAANRFREPGPLTIAGVVTVYGV